MRAERAERRLLDAHVRRRSRVAARRDDGAPAPAGQRHDQPADSGTGAARRGGARPGAPRERPGAGEARPQTLNAGMISFAKRRSVSIPPVLLSRTYSAPRSRSAWSLTAISSGVP